MKCIRWFGGAVAVILALASSGCKDDRVDSILTQQSEQQQRLAQMETRLQALERRPRLDFKLTQNQFTINEKMFTPVLVASSLLRVKGDNMPPTFYVDVMLKIEVPHLQYESIDRQIFPVVEGKSKLQMQQKLPQHGLKPEQIHVTLKPMTWYRGQIISDDMVNYDEVDNEELQGAAN